MKLAGGVKSGGDPLGDGKGASIGGSVGHDVFVLVSKRSSRWRGAASPIMKRSGMMLPRARD
jgi:hypothetical protein